MMKLMPLLPTAAIAPVEHPTDMEVVDELRQSLRTATTQIRRWLQRNHPLEPTIVVKH